MKRLFTIASMTAVAGFVFAGGAFADNADNPNNVVAKQCQAEKQAVGNKTFKEIYGGDHAMQTCKGRNADEAEEAVANASQECRAERDAIGEEAFNAQYGANKNGKNAFGKCVSGKATAEAEENAEETANAAKTCKAEREAAGDEAFTAQYGTNKNGKNAFGKCVSQHAQAEEPEPEPEPAPVA